MFFFIYDAYAYAIIIAYLHIMTPHQKSDSVNWWKKEQARRPIFIPIRFETTEHQICKEGPQQLAVWN